MTQKSEDAADRYSFRLSKRNSKRLQDELKRQDISPTELLRSIVIDYLDYEDTSERLHKEIEGQLAGMFKYIREEQKDFRDEVKEDLKENRLKIHDGLEALDMIVKKYIAHIEVLENNAKLLTKGGPPSMRS